jgi:hypothetical protein
LKNFFSEAGAKTANEINEAHTSHASFLGNNTATEFQLGRTSPADIVNMTQAVETKISADIDGIGNQLIKGIAIEISFPLAHIFN